MADTKISELTAATSVADADTFAIVQSGTTKKVAASVVKTMMNTVRTGTAAPAVNAAHIGELFVDTTNSNAYIAVTTGTGADDWFLLNDGVA